jgi:hypothetical protein
LSAPSPCRRAGAASLLAGHHVPFVTNAGDPVRFCSHYPLHRSAQLLKRLAGSPDDRHFGGSRSRQDRLPRR